MSKDLTMRLIALFLFTIILSGCANIKRVHRVDVVLNSYEQLFYSNLETDPYDDVKLKAGHLLYDYYIVFQNKSNSERYKIALAESKIVIGDSVERLRCVDDVSGSRKQLITQPGKTYKVKCSIKISPSKNKTILNSDQVAMLALPIEEGIVKFPFKLKIEDFEQ